MNTHKIGSTDAEITVADADLAQWAQTAEPSEDLRADLDRRLEADGSGPGAVMQAPLDSGVRINGIPWGWLQEFGHGTPKWRIVPLDLMQEETCVFHMAVNQVGGMMGYHAEGAVTSSGHVAAAWFIGDESNPDFDMLRVHYMSTPQLEAITQGVIDRLNFDATGCPFCPLEGWWMSLDASPLLDIEESVGRSLDQFWVPCTEHSSGYAFEEAGHWWTRRENRWRDLGRELRGSTA